MIKYDFDALASYNGRIHGLRATSPRATGKSFARNRSRWPGTTATRPREPRGSTARFFYGGEPYSQLGVVSNGYLVIGGGTAADVVFQPQTFPNENRPNNLVAPLWNDLNPPAGGAIRIGVLTDGVNSWIVVDWGRVKNFSNSTPHLFEIW